ncbi:hypothetical protein D3C76_1292530 [compost metagenome]
MGEVGEHELGVQLMRRGGKRRHVGIKVQRAWLARQLPVLSQLFFAVHFFHGGRVPFHLQCITCQLRLPVTVSNHRNTFGTAVQWYAQHGFYTFRGTCRAVIQGGDFGAEHRWP